MKDFDSIIFDLDGTLWNSVDVCVKSLNQIKEKHSDILYNITAEQVKSGMGKTATEIAKIYYGYLSKEKAEKYIQEAFIQNVKNLQKSGATLYPEVQYTIKKLSKKFKLCIVSNCGEGYIEAFLDNHGLKNCFCDYESNGKTGLSKGENIKLVIKRNNFKNSIYVGDTIGDKEAADKACIPFAYASYGFGEVNEYDYKLDKINDLLDIFQEKMIGGNDIAEK